MFNSIHLTYVNFISTAIHYAEKFFDVKPGGNWEGKIILDELKEPSEEIIANLLKINVGIAEES